MTAHGRSEEAELIVQGIEEQAVKQGKTLPRLDEERDGM